MLIYLRTEEHSRVKHTQSLKDVLTQEQHEFVVTLERQREESVVIIQMVHEDVVHTHQETEEFVETKLELFGEIERLPTETLQEKIFSLQIFTLQEQTI